jgi:glutamine synthetase
MSEPLTPQDLEKCGIDTVIVSGVDMQGRLFGKRMSPRAFRAKLDEGLHICNCVYSWDIDQNLQGLHVESAGAHTGWRDFRLVPDLTTLRLAAWLDSTAICLSDCVDEETGDLLSIAPRTILRRQVDAIRTDGFEPKVATELEFHLYEGTPSELRRASYMNLQPTTFVHADYNIAEGNQFDDFFRTVRTALESSGIPVDVSQAEWGLGQWEINLEYCSALEMADRHVLFKQAVKDMASAAGMTATFMPRPTTVGTGSSCHIHTSLEGLDGSIPFYDLSQDRTVSEPLRHAVGGLLTHASELMTWYSPTINAMRRTTSEDFAGNGLTWGLDNRTTTCRVLVGAPTINRIEFRLPGADVNPYLAVSGVLASIRDGIARQIEPGPPESGNSYSGDKRHGELPITLEAAAARFCSSDFLEVAFGKEIIDHYTAVALFEWECFLHAVTDWERRRYMEAI